MFENLTPTGKDILGQPVFSLAGVQWESWVWRVGADAGKIHEIHTTREDGTLLKLMERAGGKVGATVTVQIGHGETADISQAHPDVEAAARWALAFQPITRVAAGVVWFQTLNNKDFESWKVGLGPRDRAEISRFRGDDWSVERYVGMGLRGFTLKLTGYDHLDDGDGRLKTFEEAAEVALGIFGLVADRTGDRYRQGFEDGRQALKAAVAGL